MQKRKACEKWRLWVFTMENIDRLSVRACAGREMPEITDAWAIYLLIWEGFYLFHVRVLLLPVSCFIQDKSTQKKKEFTNSLIHVTLKFTNLCVWWGQSTHLKPQLWFYTGPCKWKRWLLCSNKMWSYCREHSHLKTKSIASFRGTEVKCGKRRPRVNKSNITYIRWSNLQHKVWKLPFSF